MPRKKSENENAPKGRNPRVSKGAEKTHCHIRDGASDWGSKNSIRENVCVNDEPLTEFKGKYYCLFHMPTKDKDVEKFEKIFKARLKAVEEKISAIEKEPEEERESAKRKISYDFRYVWFPSFVYLARYKFSADAEFLSATFSAEAFFLSATFSAYTWFDSATFLGNAFFDSAAFSANASFKSATFSAEALFRSATFSAGSSFRSATFSASTSFDSATFSVYAFFDSAAFSAKASFKWATFSAHTNFSSATFSADTDFGSAKFLETSQVFFQQTRIHKRVSFNYTIFAGYVAFGGNREAKVFLDKKEEGQDVVLNLQNARLEKPERISFHRVRLCPSWFVNTDSRKMVFTDVIWDNLDAERNNSNIADELKNLEKRNVSEPIRLLEIACRQLAVNAEENNRYEEAAQFRYMAMETKRLEYKWRGRFWTINWWYRLSSGYGENWKRAILVLLGVILFFGLLYASPLSTFDYGGTFHNMKLGEGLVHSLYVAAFQRPEPKAGDTLTKAFVILETIFAPLQAALLALAIRRKFMR
jgi:hypothetical protein